MKRAIVLGGPVLIAIALMLFPSAIMAQEPVKIRIPNDELELLSGMKKPENLIVLPGNHWIIASGMAMKSGLHPINAETKDWRRWIAPVAAKPVAPFDQGAGTIKSLLFT